MRLHEITQAPSLRPAIWHNGKVYSGGHTHLTVLRTMPPDVGRSAMGNADSRGFITPTGRFLDREQAAVYARRNNLWGKNTPDYVINAREFASEWFNQYGASAENAV
jgi:hypothetical protein